MKYWVYGLSLAAVMGAAQANEAQKLLQSFSESKRNIAFTHIIAKSGERCAAVDKTFYQGSDKRDNAIWSASCTGGKSFQVLMLNDAGGSAKVLNCEFLKKINAGACFKKY